MSDLFAGLCVVLLLAALYLARRYANRARRRRSPGRAESQHARTLSARTEMRAFASPSTTLDPLKKRSRHADGEEWKSA